MQGGVYVEHKYLVKVGWIVFEIWKAEISKISVRVNNTLVSARFSWPHDTDRVSGYIAI